MFVTHVTIQDKIGAKWPHIVKISPRYTELDRYTFTWMNFNKELEWCRNNCEADYVFKILVHDNSHNVFDSVALPKDMNVDLMFSEKNHQSAFFAFESHDEALIFSIKFER